MVVCSGVASELAGNKSNHSPATLANRRSSSQRDGIRYVFGLTFAKCGRYAGLYIDKQLVAVTRWGASLSVGRINFSGLHSFCVPDNRPWLSFPDVSGKLCRYNSRNRADPTSGNRR